GGPGGQRGGPSGREYHDERGAGTRLAGGRGTQPTVEARRGDQGGLHRRRLREPAVAGAVPIAGGVGERHPLRPAAAWTGGGSVAGGVSSGGPGDSAHLKIFR